MAKRERLRYKQVKMILSHLSRPFKADKRQVFEIIDYQDYQILMIDGQPMFLLYGDHVIPVLRLILEEGYTLPQVVVDSGAVPFITKGADLMRPGIVRMDEFGREEPVVIREERYGKPLAIGISLFSSDEISSMSSGKVVKNIHHVGDKIWSGDLDG